MTDVVTLDMDTPSVQHLCKKDKRLAKVIKMVGPIQYTLHCDDTYSFLIHEIIEQMLSVKAGQKIFSRLELLCDGKITPDKISNLSDAQIHSIGTSNAKVDYIRSVTNAITSGVLSFDEIETQSDEDAIKTLTSIRGIGTWTAKMCLIFVFDRPDILPTEDVAFLQAFRWAYKTSNTMPATVKSKCKKWKPYSSIAARFLYRALDMGFTKNEFHLFKED